MYNIIVIRITVIKIFILCVLLLFLWSIRGLFGIKKNIKKIKK